MEDWIKSITVNLAYIIEIAAAIVIGFSSIRCILYYLGNLFFQSLAKKVSPESLRLTLGKSLALALEFLLGADILRTAVSPSWNDIGQLAAIAFLRTALNFFLERELRNAQKAT